MNRSIRYRTCCTLLMLLFVGWIVSFKTIHVLASDSDHHHGCAHHHDDPSQEGDSEDCFVCEWTFPFFPENESVSAEFATGPNQIISCFGYCAPHTAATEKECNNKAPPVA